MYYISNYLYKKKKKIVNNLVKNITVKYYLSTTQNVEVGKIF